MFIYQIQQLFRSKKKRKRKKAGTQLKLKVSMEKSNKITITKQRGKNESIGYLAPKPWIESGNYVLQYFFNHALTVNTLGGGKGRKSKMYSSPLAVDNEEPGDVLLAQYGPMAYLWGLHRYEYPEGTRASHTTV